MLLTDLTELKAILEIDPNNTTEDVKLNFLITWASAWIEEILNRPGFSYSVRTEYYNGTGTQRITLRGRPVFQSPTPQVWVDDHGYYGARSGAFDGDNEELTYGNDFTIAWDQPDGTSRSAILVRIGNYWDKPTVRSAGLLSPYIGPAFGNVKVTYAAGYTVDTLPVVFRMATNLLVARMRYLLPIGMEIGSESYEERSISVISDSKQYLTGLIRPMILPYRNWSF